MKDIIIVITTTLTLSFVLTGCGTISGMGKDITSTADWTKEKLSSSKSK
jgi:predicted small secreted protein